MFTSWMPWADRPSDSPNHSNDELPYSFTADNAQVLFGASRQDLASHRQYPAGYLPELYQVPASGGRVDQVFTIPAEICTGFR